MEVVVETFGSILHGFAADNPYIEVRRLVDKRLDGFIHAVCFPPNDHITELDIPEAPAPDQVMCDTGIAPGHDYPHFCSNERQRYGIATGILGRWDYWPNNTSPKTPNNLLKIRDELTIGYCSRVLSPSVAKRSIDSTRKYHGGQRLDMHQLLVATLRGIDMGARPEHQNKTRLRAAEETSARAGKVEMPEEIYNFYNSTVIVYSPVFEETPASKDLAGEQAHKKAVATHDVMEGVLYAAQLVPVHETLHATSTFTATIPDM